MLGNNNIFCPQEALQIASGRIAQLLNASDIAKIVGVDVTTIQSLVALFEQNGVLRILFTYYVNLNQRLIKTPKIYFEDVGLAVRLQGWTAFEPILLSPYFGHLFKNLVLSEIVRFFLNRGEEPQIFFVRSKAQEEIDFLLQLSNQRFIAIEVTVTPMDMTAKQMHLLDSLKLNIIDKWVVSSVRSTDFANARVICLDQIHDQLAMLHN